MAVFTYKCPNCDGGLIFDPKTQDFACEYCISHFTEEELKAKEIEKAGEPEQEIKAETQEVVFSCPSCGAEVVSDATTAATYCYYCHNPVILEGRLDGAYRPDTVIPFKIEKAQVNDVFLNWAKKKWFVPANFCSKENIEKITGVYFPHWLIDSSLNGTLTGTATQVRTWRTGDYRYTETKHFNIRREGHLEVKDLVKNALNKEEVDLLKSVQPFDLSEKQNFTAAYLSGYQAEKRNIEAADLTPEVQKNIEDAASSELRRSVSGYSSVKAGNVQVRDLDMDWSYTMLPVWVLTYRTENKEMYYFAMNGQNGKTNGRVPLDKGKLLRVSSIISGAVFVVSMLAVLAGRFLG